MSPHVLAARYIAFAVLATLANLATQRLVFTGAGTMPQLEPILVYCTAVAAGTLTGLLLKYVLDKRWIFHDRTQGLQAHGRQFTLYVLMGVATTAIFWGTETLFWLVWHSQVAREAGAAIGLSIGYVVKYRLDRKFVFRQQGWSTAP
ncbi:GtrA family protein [Novosphingobium album (ex Hu et al. 2023)]|uniref:GtrA family protein n=1 Tax=Novosphingobium album (ex Hu et al. 2023) TaxID=2930093 RepID=A0ABT0B6T4_9SPHN|nr:GtrA family protein [Novosphingobium album (ex Hu et al. 2023)]MCJ2180624.1 GtrA family protein [Novosphingobium album (ex Hu et al. 2023)]